MRVFLPVLLISITFCCRAQDPRVHSVTFPSAEALISKRQVKALDSVLSLLEGPLNSYSYDIQGHTDSVGDYNYNLQLSENRCKSVRTYLLKKGVDQKRISIGRHSYDLPLTDNTSEEGRSMNRRATLTIALKLDAPDWKLRPQIFKIDPKKENTIKTRNGCRLLIPADAFVTTDELMPVMGRIKIQVTEYNNPADFIASGIPMSFAALDKLFMYHSHEMLNIKAFVGQYPVYLKDSVKIGLMCRIRDSLNLVGFYRFNLEEQNWFEENKSTLIEAEIGAIATATEEAKPEKAELPGENKTTEKATTSEQNDQAEPDKKEPEPENQPQTETLVLTKGQAEPEPFKKQPDPIEEPTDTATGLIQKPVKIEPPPPPPPPPPPDTSWVRLKLDTMVRSRGPCCPPDQWCQCLAAHIENALEITRRPLITTWDTSWTKYFEQRYHDLNYSGTNRIEDPGRIKYYPVKVRAKKNFLRRSATIKLKFDKYQNPELYQLRDLQWTYRFRDNEENYRKLAKMKISDIRIEYDSLTKQARFELKEKDKFTGIVLKPRRPKNGGVEEKLRKYEHVLSYRRRKFDFEHHNDAIAEINMFYQRYTCFRHFRFSCFAPEERDMEYRTWIGYINNRLQAVHAQYDSLSREEIEWKKKCCPEKSGQPKLLLKTKGIDRLLIIGLGLYNYDEVIELRNVVTIGSPVFVDPKGKQVRVHKSFLLLEGVNGMMHFDGKSLMRLVGGQRNIIFIVDEAGRRFRLTIEAGTDLERLGKKFVLSDITSKTETLEGLERELER